MPHSVPNWAFRHFFWRLEGPKRFQQRILPKFVEETNIAGYCTSTWCFLLSELVFNILWIWIELIAIQTSILRNFKVSKPGGGGKEAWISKFFEGHSRDAKPGGWGGKEAWILEFPAIQICDQAFEEHEVVVTYKVGTNFAFISYFYLV